jgi:hypothetical protein
MSSIYGLFDATGALRYIGKANDPEHRLNCHVRDTLSGRRNYPVNHWIRKNGRPELRVLSADCHDWRAEERRLIAEARARGDRLLNIADGGDEPHCSPEQRSANGKAMSQHPNTLASRKANYAKMRRALDDDPQKEAARELMVRLGHFVRSIVATGQYSREWLERGRERARVIHTKRPDLFPNIVKLYDRIPEPQD